ncbi:hypothetical protein [Nocardia brevicatena]|nr:hypothetical protein [Nocardia brevicatena]
MPARIRECGTSHRYPADDAGLADISGEYSVGRSTIHRVISGTTPQV